MAVIQLLQQLEGLFDAFASVGEALFFQHVQAADAEIADIIAYQAGDVVIAHQQEVDRHVLAVADQLVAATRIFQAALLQQFQAVLGQAPRFLDSDLDTCLWFSHVHFSHSFEHGE